MYYREFREELLQMMKDQAEAGFELELVERQKLNGQLRYALMIQGEGSVCAPVIYLEEVYEEFCHGRPMEEIAGRLWLIYQEEMKDDIQYLYDHISCMLTFDAASNGLYVRIMNYEKNRDLLHDVPFRRILDFALTVYYQVQQADGHVRGTVMLREEHIQDWSVSTEEVFEKAIENTLRSEGLYWNSMDAVLRREKLLLFPEKLPESRTGMIVLSGKTGVWGATAAFLPGTAARIYEALGEAFYFLPSSIHEVIIVPFSHAVGGKYLAQTVKDINRMEIPTEEILSDHIYLYNVQTGQMEIVEDTE